MINHIFNNCHLYIFLLLLISVDLHAATFELHHGTPMYGTTIKKSAPVREGPSEKSNIVGYVPGALRVWVDITKEVNGWVPVGINWKYSGKLWIARSDIAISSDYQPYKGKWPLEYIKFVSEVSNFIWVFPENNNCSSMNYNKIINRVPKKYHVPKNNIFCQEIWWVPNTNIFYANPHGEDIDIWYEGDGKTIIVNFIADHYTYGYRDGKYKMVVGACKPGKDIGCRIISKILPPTSSNK